GRTAPRTRRTAGAGDALRLPRAAPSRHHLPAAVRAGERGRASRLRSESKVRDTENRKKRDSMSEPSVKTTLARRSELAAWQDVRLRETVAHVTSRSRYWA